jgi:uncharacterized repeat protein (TIGR01451 family)
MAASQTAADAGPATASPASTTNDTPANPFAAKPAPNVFTQPMPAASTDRRYGAQPAQFLAPADAQPMPVNTDTVAPPSDTQTGNNATAPNPFPANTTSPTNNAPPAGYRAAPADDRYGSFSAEPAQLPNGPAAQPFPAPGVSQVPAPTMLPAANLPTNNPVNMPQAGGPAEFGVPNNFPAGNLPNSNFNTTSSSPAVSGTGRPGIKQLHGPQTPSLVVEKITPAEVQVGKPATFTLHIRNVGGATAQDIVVRDEVPQGAQLLSTKPRAERSPRGELIWQLGTLKPSDELTVEMELLPVTEGELGSVATVQCAALASGRSVATRPELALDVNAPREVLAGEEVVLQIKISNTGSGAATGVVLGDRLPPNLEHAAGGELEYEVGTLAPGESRTVELVMRALKAGPAVNQLTIRGSGIAPAERQSTLTVIAPALDVALEGSRRRFLDRQAVYTLSITNPGSAVAEAVELTAYLPPGLEFVDANNQGQYDRRSRAVHWLLEELPPQQKGTVTLTVLPTAAGQQALRLAGAARRGLSVERPETISVEGVAALSYEVTDSADPIGVGDEMTYEIRVLNQGSKAADNVQVTVLLPAEVKPLSAEAPVRFEAGAGQVRFQPLPQLAPKAETTFRVRVQALAAGDLRARVQLTSDEIRAPITKEESTHVVAE